MMRIVYSEHAETRIAERTIFKEHIEEAIRNPDISYENVPMKKRIRVHKKIGKRMLVVVYKPGKNAIRVITVWWSEDNYEDECST